MAVESVGAVASNTSELSQSANLGQEEFLKILLTQLTYQDPLKPMDNQEFIAQMAQFTSLEQAQQSNDKLDTLLTIQSSNQSLSLLNKSVDFTTSAGLETGEVISIRFEQGVPVMTVKKAGDVVVPNVSLSQISRVE